MKPLRFPPAVVQCVWGCRANGFDWTENITKSYPLDGLNLKILKGISLTIESEGSLWRLWGRPARANRLWWIFSVVWTSPSSGHYQLDGKNVEKLSADELAEIRNQKIGFVFQGFNLLSRTTALENVELPMVLCSSCRWWAAKTRGCRIKAGWAG